MLRRVLDGWRGGGAAGGEPPRPTAATPPIESLSPAAVTPIENPYRSCKLTHTWRLQEVAAAHYERMLRGRLQVATQICTANMDCKHRLQSDIEALIASECG